MVRQDWIRLLDILAVEHHFDKHYCLYRLSLSDLLNYVGARNERIRQQNEASTPESESPGFPPRRSRVKEKRIEKPTISQVKAIFGGLTF